MNFKMKDVNSSLATKVNELMKLNNNPTHNQKPNKEPSRKTELNL